MRKVNRRTHLLRRVNDGAIGGGYLAAAYSTRGGGGEEELD
jgi:hypothetical protein